MNFEMNERIVQGVSYRPCTNAHVHSLSTAIFDTSEVPKEFIHEYACGVECTQTVRVLSLRMRWLQKNQAHLLVVERARLENNAKRTRLPGKTIIFSCLLASWGILWLLSAVAYSSHDLMKKTTTEEHHDHKSLRYSSPILKDLKRPRSGECFFNPSERPRQGYIVGKCIEKQSCTWRESLSEAQDACLLSSECGGVTFVPWEERFELRDSNVVKESFDGQLAFLKRCDFGKAKAEEILNEEDDDGDK